MSHEKFSVSFLAGREGVILYCILILPWHHANLCDNLSDMFIAKFPFPHQLLNRFPFSKRAPTFWKLSISASIRSTWGAVVPWIIQSSAPAALHWHLLNLPFQVQMDLVDDSLVERVGLILVTNYTHLGWEKSWVLIKHPEMVGLAMLKLWYEYVFLVDTDIRWIYPPSPRMQRSPPGWHYQVLGLGISK